MIYQSLALSTAAGFLVAANAAPKRADYYPFTPLWSSSTISKVLDIRGLGYAIAIALLILMMLVFSMLTLLVQPLGSTIE
jgi:hypothetical protein